MLGVGGGGGGAGRGGPHSSPNYSQNRTSGRRSVSAQLRQIEKVALTGSTELDSTPSIDTTSTATLLPATNTTPSSSSSSSSPPSSSPSAGSPAAKEAPAGGKSLAKFGRRRSSMVDTSSPRIRKAYEAVRADDDDTNWALFSYTTPSQSAIDVLSTGNGGLAELKSHFKSDFLGYAVVRVITESQLTKFVFISWIGKEVSVLKRARVSVHKPSVKNQLEGCALEIHATSLEEVDEEAILKRVGASGTVGYLSPSLGSSNGTAQKKRSPACSPAVPRAASTAASSPQANSFSPNRALPRLFSCSPSSDTNGAPTITAKAVAITPKTAPPQSSPSLASSPSPSANGTNKPTVPSTSDTDASSASPAQEKEAIVAVANSKSFPRKLAYGVGAVQGVRPTMEDRHYANLSLPKNGHLAMFGVYDGHAGEEAADFVAQHLHKQIDAHLAQNSDMEAAITAAFLVVDEDFMDEAESMMWYSGTVVVCAFLDTQKQEVLVANLGDSRCVLSRNGEAVAMSRDHKPTDPTEMERIEAAGCTVTEGRINGTHAMSRAIGDAELKQNINLELADQAISNAPEFRREKLNGAEEFILLACDGLWDVMSNEEAVAWVNDRLQKNDFGGDLNVLAAEMAAHAVQIGSTDNVSVCIVTLP
ncbi:Protein phosphatase 2C 2 [Balamuthia mandrillaris]